MRRTPSAAAAAAAQAARRPARRLERAQLAQHPSWRGVGESTAAPSRRAARASRACPRAAERQRAAQGRGTAARRLGRTRDALRGRRRHLQALERTAAQTYPSSCHCGLHLRAQIRPTGVSVRPTVRVEGETLAAGKAARTFRPPGFHTPRALETREQKAIGQRVARAARASGASCPWPWRWGLPRLFWRRVAGRAGAAIPHIGHGQGRLTKSTADGNRLPCGLVGGSG